MRSIRTMMTNIAQLLLLYLLFPIFIFACEASSPLSSTSAIINFLGQVPLCDTIADILSQYVSGITSNDIAQLTLWVFFKELPAAMIMGISVHFCIAVFDIVWDPVRLEDKSFHPLPILPGFFGIFLSTIITNVIGLTANDVIVFFAEFGVVIVMLLGIRLMFSALKKPKSIFTIKKILEWIIDGIYAVILSIYVASAIFIIQGGFGNFGKDLGHVLLMSTITLIASVVVYIVRLGED